MHLSPHNWLMFRGVPLLAWVCVDFVDFGALAAKEDPWQFFWLLLYPVWRGAMDRVLDSTCGAPSRSWAQDFL